MGFPEILSKTAVFISTYNEGPFLENILNWLLPIVPKIVIAESRTTFHGRHSVEDSLTKQIVLRVLKNNPSASSIVEYLEVDGEESENPSIKETSKRNFVLDKIQRDGFDWVWVIDADEVYTNSEAENIWNWFEGVVRDSLWVMGARCSMFTYWRSLHYRIDPPERLMANVILRADCRFSCIRHTTSEQFIVDVPKGVCVLRHYSWVRTPEQARTKIASWGHAHQVLSGWMSDVFMKWSPESGMRNLHPTEGPAYQIAVPCLERVPECLSGHPWVGVQKIIDDTSSMKIKVIILNHNRPENSDKLFVELSRAFDGVEVWDSGSSKDKIPIHVTRSYPNIYWTGAWNEAMRLCGGFDAVWLLGCDIELRSEPVEYREAIEKSLPFGVWSPCVEGRAHPFMLAEHYREKLPRSVKNIEGMALAVSGALMREVKALLPGSEIGFGQDYWLCHRARELGLKNIIDGRVEVFHPAGIGYNEKLAHDQMEKAFTEAYGPDFRKTVFEYSPSYEGNLHSGVVGSGLVKKDRKESRVMVTIFTVDNGWGVVDFMDLAKSYPNCRKVIVKKGVSSLSGLDGVEVIPYNGDFSQFEDGESIGLFPRVGPANSEDFKNIVLRGIPVVAHSSFNRDVIIHMQNGYLYLDRTWAIHWLNELINNKDMRLSVKKSGSSAAATVEVKAEKIKESLPLVSVITPTYRREAKIVRRCVNCLQLQTVSNWEQVICSDGEQEKHIKDLVENLGDSRVTYKNTTGKKPGDFGNTVRSEMLKEARGEFVLFCDDDNVILPNYFEKMVEALRRDRDAGFAICRVIHFGPLNESEVGKAPKVLTGLPPRLYHIDTLQVLVRREAMQSVGWDTEHGYIADGYSLQNLSSKFKWVEVADVLGVHL